ncbi:coatomer subunit beta'-2 [Lactuca sativa]|uniref:coatomer subunit beta'-2 n=1 Tax=Lactuca sativa TaxID=4236 RepID=UPI001C68CC55|nr:coatomer subunit beta'-2 [Lactuca sativa]
MVGNLDCWRVSMSPPSTIRQLEGERISPSVRFLHRSCNPKTKRTAVCQVLGVTFDCLHQSLKSSGSGCGVIFDIKEKENSGMGMGEWECENGLILKVMDIDGELVPLIEEKIWNLGSPDPNFTLDAHLKGVNSVDYFTGGDKPYLITGSDDHTAKVWDYQTKTCVQTLEGHTHNVSTVCFHPELPIIMTGSEDATVRIWHSTTYRLENTLNYGLERVWAIGYMKDSRRIVIGYDEGTIMVKIGHEEPVASMDNSGKIIWAKHNEIQTVNIKSVGADHEVWTLKERLPLVVKELGTCDFYPQSLKHNPNGRFVVVCGDGEYIIYTALAWRNRSFGSALEIVWSSDGEYVVRESTSKIKIFNKSFQEKKSIRPTFSAEKIFGGSLLAMCSNDFICFYDWAECRLIQRIDVNVKVSFFYNCLYNYFIKCLFICFL